MFEQITLLATTKNQLSKLEQLRKKFKPTRAAEMGKLHMLAYDFFISENQEATKLCIQIILDTGLHLNDSVLWTPVEACYALKFWLSNHDGQKQIHQIVMERLDEWFNQRYTSDKQAQMEKYLSMFMSEDILDSERKEYLSAANSPKEKFESGIHLLSGLFTQIVYYELDNPNRKPLIAEAEKIIIELKDLFLKINKMI